MSYNLIGRLESVTAIVALFRESEGNEIRLSVREDQCFSDEGCLNLGRIVIKPGEADPGEDALTLAVEHGFFEWHLPDADQMVSDTHALMGLDLPKSNEDQKSKARLALDGVTNAACRIGLIHPVLDAGSLSDLPLSRPATIVVDTSAIVQGGLDFVIRFLYPMARIKVPAIAHMELLNSADNFFNLRRKDASARGRMLSEHVVSQGGQRALLRSELQTSTEIERGRLGADPLRGVVGVGSDSEDKSLGLSVVQRSFADRLIFETARQHAAQSSQDHRVLLMTCDQGLARMTIAEGMQPLFFEHGTLSRLSSRILTGTVFHPFSGGIYDIPLTSLVWELAVSFGMCRLSSLSNGAHLDVCAIGPNLPWKPYHTKDDLLWVARKELAGGPARTKNLAGEVEVSKKNQASHARVRTGRSDGTNVNERRDKRSPTGAYKFSPNRMITLVHALTQKHKLVRSDAMRVLDLHSSSQLGDYRNFLASGGFIEAGEKSLVKTDELDLFWSAIKTMNRKELGSYLLRVPSFKAFMARVASHRFRPAADEEFDFPKRAVPSYLALAEAAILGLGIPDEGIYATPTDPPPAEFTEIALDTYSAISMGSNDYVLTGLWLEALARERGIHPIAARDRLQEASAAGYLQRFTEGSTPETSYPRHSVSVLDQTHGMPSIQKVSLFEGDFLLPGKSSVSLKLVRGSQ